MLKLNNRGWSLNLMVGIICLFLLVVILIYIMFVNFSDGDKEPNPLLENNPDVVNKG